jgi:transcriptional regulator with XRE-family HTH domain
MDIEELVSSRIRKARRIRELSQQEAADLVGISQHAWATYELGTRKVSLRMLQIISDKLDFPIEFFVSPKYDIKVEEVEIKKAAARRHRAA